MRETCAHLFRMGVMIQIRNVPAPLHRELKARAALAGKSLSDYLLDEIADAARKPTLEQWLARLRSDPPTQLSESAADIIRGERDSR